MIGERSRPIVTRIEPTTPWVRAEEYHQDYLIKHPDGYNDHWLRDFDFVGRSDDWKQRWTDRGREQVTVAVYRGARGIAHYALSVLVRPHLP